jgi:hypothetical protein
MLLHNSNCCFNKQGYLIIPRLFAHKVDAINTEIDRLKTDKTIDFNFTGKK